MDVDRIMDTAIKAAEDTFGRPVIYTPAGGSPVSVVGDFSPTFRSVSPSAPAWSAAEPTLDCREATLTAAGITPAKDDKVSFAVLGVTRTYWVVDIHRGDVGSVLLLLGQRG